MGRGNWSKYARQAIGKGGGFRYDKNIHNIPVNKLKKQDLGSYISVLNARYSEIQASFEDDYKGVEEYVANMKKKADDYAVEREINKREKMAENIKKEVQRQYKRYMKM